MGTEGLRAASEWAVINNNYLIKKLLEVRGMDISWPNRRKLQEARFSLGEALRGDRRVRHRLQLPAGRLRRGDVLREPRSADHREPVTPEPTEGQSREDLDRFIDAFHQISEEAYSEPEIVHNCAAPLHRPS